jgi:hypothetical protein
LVYDSSPFCFGHYQFATVRVYYGNICLDFEADCPEFVYDNLYNFFIMRKNDKKEKNELLSQKQFHQLAGVQGRNCISIYIPTARAGEEVDSKMGERRLKNQLKAIKSTLKEHGLSKNQIKEAIKPAADLLKDVHFWRNQSDGLAIFLQKGEMEYYILPLDFKERNYIADHYYLLPLIPLFNDNGRFFLLVLSQQNINLFEGSRHSITEIFMKDLFPGKLEDVVGYDHEEKSLQHRSGQGGEAGAMFHGQGEGKDDKEHEIEKLFRAVDKELMKVLNNEKAPLILACVDHYFPIFNQVTRYGNLFNRYLGGNYDHTDPIELHERAWMLVSDYFQGNRKQKIKQFNDLSASEKTLKEFRDIFPAAVEGRVDTLFILKGAECYGYYDEAQHALHLESKDNTRKINHADLYNIVAMLAIQNGGSVYLEEPENMPLNGSEINALLRY